MKTAVLACAIVRARQLRRIASNFVEFSQPLELNFAGCTEFAGCVGFARKTKQHLVWWAQPNLSKKAHRQCLRAFVSMQT